MMASYKDIAERYPIVSIKDPFDQDHWDAYTERVAEMDTERGLLRWADGKDGREERGIGK